MMPTRSLACRIIAATAASAVLLLSAQSAASISETTDVVVAVHRDVPVDGLTMAELRRIVIGDREFWPGSIRVTLLLRAPVSHERDVVLRNVAQMSEGQFRQHWIGKVFRADTPVAPKIVYSPEMSVDLVNRIPGAITFIDASNATRSLKVLKIDGKLPGEAGYPLR
jgi:ABC-type phosphate transport system substrate-binding protein